MSTGAWSPPKPADVTASRSVSNALASDAERKTRLHYLAALPCLWPQDMQEVIDLVKLTRVPVTIRRTDLTRGTIRIIVIEPDGETELT